MQSCYQFQWILVMHMGARLCTKSRTKLEESCLPHPALRLDLLFVFIDLFVIFKPGYITFNFIWKKWQNERWLRIAVELKPRTYWKPIESKHLRMSRNISVKVMSSEFKRKIHWVRSRASADKMSFLIFFSLLLPPPQSSLQLPILYEYIFVTSKSYTRLFSC